MGRIREFISWPPSGWSAASARIPNLETATIQRVVETPSGIVVEVRDNGEAFLGALSIPNPALRSRVANVISQLKGRTTQEVGEYSL
jgi:hypothetical protein